MQSSSDPALLCMEFSQVVDPNFLLMDGNALPNRVDTTDNYIETKDI